MTTKYAAVVRMGLCAFCFAAVAMGAVLFAGMAAAQNVDTLNTQQSVGEATETLRASAAQVLTALDQAYNSVQCAQ